MSAWTCCVVITNQCSVNKEAVSEVEPSRQQSRRCIDLFHASNNVSVVSFIEASLVVSEFLALSVSDVFYSESSDETDFTRVLEGQTNMNVLGQPRSVENVIKVTFNDDSAIGCR